MSFPVRAIVKLKRIFFMGLVIAGAFYAVMLMPKMLKVRKSNQEDIGKEEVFKRVAFTLIVPLDTGKHP